MYIYIYIYIYIYNVYISLSLYIYIYIYILRAVALGRKSCYLWAPITKVKLLPIHKYIYIYIYIYVYTYICISYIIIYTNTYISSYRNYNKQRLDRGAARPAGDAGVLGWLGIHQRGVQSEGGAVDGGSII